MRFIVGFFSLEWMRVFDFIPPLVIRLFLAPMFWVAGVQHLGLFSSSDFLWWNPLTWINTEAFQQSVAAISNSPLPGVAAETLVILIGTIEIVGAILLVLGFAVRWIVLALMFVVVVMGLMSIGDSGVLNTMQQLVMTHGYSDITNNVTEMYLVNFILLLALFFMGAGRWVSMDWYIYRSLMKKVDRKGEVVEDTADPFEIDATDEPGISNKV